MNPMVTNIIIYEKELEIQRQSRDHAYYQPEIELPGEPRRRQESRWSYMADLFRASVYRRNKANKC